MASVGCILGASLGTLLVGCGIFSLIVTALVVRTRLCARVFCHARSTCATTTKFQQRHGELLGSCGRHRRARHVNRRWIVGIAATDAGDGGEDNGLDPAVQDDGFDFAVGDSEGDCVCVETLPPRFKIAQAALSGQFDTVLAEEGVTQDTEREQGNISRVLVDWPRWCELVAVGDRPDDASAQAFEEAVREVAFEHCGQDGLTIESTNRGSKFVQVKVRCWVRRPETLNQLYDSVDRLDGCRFKY